MNLINVEWKSIAGFEKYEVSNNGKVRNANTKRVLTPFIDKDGFVRINLYDEQGRRKSRVVGSLVARAFIDNPLDLPIVKYIDGNKANVKANNITWSMRADVERASTMAKAITMLDLRGNVLAQYESISEASRQTGYALANISACARDKLKTYYGKVFRYTEES